MTILPARVWEFSGNFNEKGEALWCSRPVTRADKARRSEILLGTLVMEGEPAEAELETEHE